jgi:hypothetical protein
VSINVKTGKIAEISEKANIQVKHLRELQKQLQLDIKFLAQRISVYYNKKRLERPRFREGNKVYLVRRNIRIIRLSDKLNYRKFKLFKIIRYVKGTSFKLQLLLTIKIHPVFYIFLLEPAYSKTPEEFIPEIN